MRSAQQVGARRAGLSYAVQSLFVARERRELDGLVEVLDALAEEHPNQPGFLTTAAWVRIETGQFDEARRQFEAIGADGFDSILRNGVWLPNMRLLSEIACALATPGPAARLVRAAAPYRDRFIVTSRVLSFLGSVEHSLGALAITTGELDRAEAHLTRARAKHVALGAPLLVARTDLAIAALFEARGDARRRGVRAPRPAARRGSRQRLARPRRRRGGRRRLRRRFPRSGFPSEQTFATLRAMLLQGTLLGGGEPEIDAGATFERVHLDDHSWVDVAREWMRGADTLLDALLARVEWKQGKRWMYERMVDDPRLLALVPRGRAGAASRARHGPHRTHGALRRPLRERRAELLPRRQRQRRAGTATRNSGSSRTRGSRSSRSARAGPS